MCFQFVPLRTQGLDLERVSETMGTIELTSNNFESTIASTGITIVDLWASWCGPCQKFGPIFEAAAQKHPDITFGKVNTESEQNLASSLQIKAIPTLMIFRDGQLLFKEAGALPSEHLERLIAWSRETEGNTESSHEHTSDVHF